MVELVDQAGAETVQAVELLKLHFKVLLCMLMAAEMVYIMVVVAVVEVHLEVLAYIPVVVVQVLLVILVAEAEVV
ncbi:MAG: hypothetical protein EB124_12905 [Betaproteobacteria bacterium]|nr:hypothetical protein [Betaproteobacteria bacterium]